MPRPSAALAMASATKEGMGSVVSPMPRLMILASGRCFRCALRRFAICGRQGGEDRQRWSPAVRETRLSHRRREGVQVPAPSSPTSADTQVFRRCPTQLRGLLCMTRGCCWRRHDGESTYIDCCCCACIDLVRTRLPIAATELLTNSAAEFTLAACFVFKAGDLVAS